MLIALLYLIKSSQGPSFLPTGKGSQVAKKNLSNIVAAKTVKVHSVLLMLCVVSVCWTIVISFCSVSESHGCLSPGWIYSKLWM